MATPDKDDLFEFQLEGLDTLLRVIRFEGHEAISRLFEFDITLVADTADIDLDAALQAGAVFTIHSRDRTRSAAYRGMVAQFEQTGAVDDYYFYRARLVPRLWRAGLNRLNEVYLEERSIPELIAYVLDERTGLRGPDVDFGGLRNRDLYRKRSFTCQYQESDLAFISRWMEQEGLYYIFDHDGSHSGEVLKIIDHAQGQPADALALRYTPPENVQTDRQDETVTSFICRKSHQPGAALVQDFNFRKASLGDDLKSEAAVSGGMAGSRYMLYGQNLRTEADAERLARVRSQEFASQATVFLGEAPAIGVRSGYFLDLDHHFRRAFNARYLVTEVHHQGSQAGVVLAGQTTQYNRGEQGSTYQCRFQAIEGSLQFRAARITPQPRIDGVLSAIIDAEGEGQLAELNEYGQYKVQLLYDYSAKDANKGSSWLRMATPYAGKYEGMHFPLLKGTEVLLAFVQGDPDQPIILGAVPNSENPSIIHDRIAATNGIRTVGGNTLQMIDTPGKQTLTLYSPVGNTMMYLGSFPQPVTGEPPSPLSDPAETFETNS